jgi:hypothetical protein
MKAFILKSISLKALLAVAAMILLGGCQTPLGVRKVKPSGFLKDYSQLKAGESGQAKLVYINPNTNFAKYDKVMIAPITVWVKADSKLAKLPKKDLEALANYLDATVRENLKKDYTIVKQPGPDVMRLRIAITEGKKANVVMNTVSTIVPVGLAIDVVKFIAVGTHTSVGEASVEAEIVDSVSGERLIAAVDGRAGRKNLVSGNFTGWGDVQDAYDYWAKKLQARLAELRVKQNK